MTESRRQTSRRTAPGRFRFVACMLLAGLLAGCASGGMVRRVSEPAASIQQLTVRADGSWSVDLRINNYSSIPMRFDAISLALDVGGPAGTLAGNAGISIGPESADVVTLAHVPPSQSRIALADALASGRGIAYSFKGTLSAAPEDGGARSYDVEHTSSLAPVPGLAGVLR